MVSKLEPSLSHLESKRKILNWKRLGLKGKVLGAMAVSLVVFAATSTYVVSNMSKIEGLQTQKNFKNDQYPKMLDDAIFVLSNMKFNKEYYDNRKQQLRKIATIKIRMMMSTIKRS